MNLLKTPQNNNTLYHQTIVHLNDKYIIATFFAFYRRTFFKKVILLPLYELKRFEEKK